METFVPTQAVVYELTVSSILLLISIVLSMKDYSTVALTTKTTAANRPSQSLHDVLWPNQSYYGSIDHGTCASSQ
ncbi:hypothetical protein KIN20_019973, partial [Parelaphostrongylus tenuis]